MQGSDIQKREPRPDDDPAGYHTSGDPLFSRLVGIDPFQETENPFNCRSPGDLVTREWRRLHRQAILAVAANSGLREKRVFSIIGSGGERPCLDQESSSTNDAVSDGFDLSD